MELPRRLTRDSIAVMWEALQSLSRVAPDKWRRGASLAALALVTATAVPIANAVFQSDLHIPGTAQAKDLLNILSDRSPGERLGAALTKSKSKAAAQQLAKAADKPRQTTLAKAPAPPEVPSSGRLLSIPAELSGSLFQEPGAVGNDLALAGGPFLGGPVVADILAPGGAGGFVGGGGGGGSGGGGGISTPPATESPAPSVPAPVPEPSTWAMMLVGFGAIGFAMRRRRKTHPQVQFAS